MNSQFSSVEELTVNKLEKASMIKDAPFSIGNINDLERTFYISLVGFTFIVINVMFFHRKSSEKE